MKRTTNREMKVRCRNQAAGHCIVGRKRRAGHYPFEGISQKGALGKAGVIRSQRRGTDIVTTGRTKRGSSGTVLAGTRDSFDGGA